MICHKPICSKYSFILFKCSIILIRISFFASNLRLRILPKLLNPEHLSDVWLLASVVLELASEWLLVRKFVVWVSCYIWLLDWFRWALVNVRISHCDIESQFEHKIFFFDCWRNCFFCQSIFFQIVFRDWSLLDSCFVIPCDNRMTN